MISRLVPLLSLAAALGAPSVCAAREGLRERVEAMLTATLPGARFGLVVTTADGTELVTIAPTARFIPASNTKLLTTAAAFATLGDVDRLDAASGASVRLDGDGRPVPDVVLRGRGDARLSSASDCRVDCLATLADAVAARARVVGDVVGDDSFFPDQRWSAGMSWNNMDTRSGTAVSALTLDDSEITLVVAPGTVGRAPVLDHSGYYSIDNRAVTIGSGATDLAFERPPASRTVRLTGTIVAGAAPERLRLGLADAAHYAAWRLRTLLQARGVRVLGAVVARHRPATAADDPALRGSAPVPRPPEPDTLARLEPPALIETIARTNKASQNVYAELLLRRVGHAQGSGSVEDGLAVVRAMLERAGVARADYDVSDGSGMSSYNRIAPRGMVRLLGWAATQPWGARWRSTLPVAGVDGTLERRFKGTVLEGRLFAKTGTLNATAALAGYMVGASGRELVFAAYANDMPNDASGAGPIDAALVLIASEN